jgi:hypothetical protein
MQERINLKKRRAKKEESPPPQKKIIKTRLRAEITDIYNLFKNLISLEICSRNFIHEVHSKFFEQAPVRKLQLFTIYLQITICLKYFLRPCPNNAFLKEARSLGRGRCYDHDFCDFWQFSAKKMWVFLNNQCYDQNFALFAFVLGQNAIFLQKNLRKYFKNHNIGPRFCADITIRPMNKLVG